MAAALIELLERTRVLPVLTIATMAEVEAIHDGLVAGALPVAEVTLRTPAALDAIRALAGEADLLVGAGTVLSIDQAERALEAGAAYLVSPGTTPALVEWCLGSGVTVIPGVATPTEALAARDFGLTVAKLFPASVVGGPSWLRAVAAPVPDLRFIATGGVTDAALPDYLGAPNLLAVGGSWFMPAVGAGFTGGAVADGVRATLARVAQLTGTVVTR